MSNSFRWCGRGAPPRHALAALALATVGASPLACASTTISQRGASIVVAGIPVDIPISYPSGGSSRSGGSAPSSGSASARRTLSTAERYLGVPYKWGGDTPSEGFDCSGFVQYVFRKEDVRLPRTSRQQAAAGRRLPAKWSSVSAGDLVMFAEPGERISHVAIYAGNRRIIHSSSSGGGVRYDDLDTRRGQWFAKRMVAARRVVSNGQSLVDDLLMQFGQLAPGMNFDPPDHAPRR